MQRVVLALLLLATPFAYAATQPSLAQLQANDAHVLQYALLLERLEFFFYNKYQGQFTANDFTAAGLTATDYTYFDLIKAHEQAHVNFLNPLVADPGQCTYSFPVTDVASYIRVAALLENTGVSAYDGAINRIYNTDTQQAAATIATVEARHASYLNVLNQTLPFPNAYDTPLTPTQISGAVFGAGGFATCNFTTSFALPELYTVQPIANASDPSQPTATTLGANDLLVLQYALFLEHLEAAFYTDVVSRFNGSFPNATVYQYFQLIQQHETSHVSALTSTISSLGGTPAAACTSYNFTSVKAYADVIATAATLENTGVYAYDGAVNAIYNSALKQTAATIATVEARHASYLNTLAGNSQGPVQGGNTAANGAYDNAFNFTTIVPLVLGTGLIGDCANSLPAVQPFTVYTVKPYTEPTAAPTSAPTAAPTSTTGATSATTSAATSATTSATTSAPTTRPTTAGTTARTTTNDATIATASVAVALLVAMVAL